MPQQQGVLLLDEHSDYLAIVEAVAASLGQRLVKATSLKAALGKLQQREFVTIILNATVSGRGIGEEIRQIRAIATAQHTPILILIASTDEIDIETGSWLGEVDYLIEPIEPSLLKAKVAMAMRVFAQTQQLASLNQQLQREITQRQAIETELQQTQRELVRRNSSLETTNEELQVSWEQIQAAQQDQSQYIEELHIVEEELRLQNEELKLAQQAIEQERRKYWNLFNFAPDGYLITDSKGIIQQANQVTTVLLEMPAEFLVGKPLFLFVPLQEQPVFSSHLQHLKATSNPLSLDQPYIFEITLRSWQGRSFPVMISAQAFLDSPEDGVSIRWLIRDISQRKQMEESLRRSEERFRRAFGESLRLIEQIADTTPTMLYLYNLNQRRNTYLNRYGTDFFGKSQAEIAAEGEPFFVDVLRPEDAAKLAELPQRFAQLAEGGVVENEFQLKNQHGEWRWFHTWEIIFTRDAQGKPEQVLGTAVDISEYKQAEAMRRALAAEQELRQVQLRFFSMIAHEFRTPLTSILGVTNLLDAGTQDWSKEKKFRNIKRLKTAANTMNQLLNDLLMINRAESGKLENNPRPMNLEQFCNHLLDEFKATTEPKYEFTLLSQGQCHTVVLDENLLRSILSNLLSNAVKYSPQGGEIQLMITCDRQQVIFQIRDSGIGIPDEALHHLFELFYRGDNIDAISGTGLGLCVVKKCLDIQGGQIAIESEEGVGTIITVTLPRNQST